MAMFVEIPVCKVTRAGSMTDERTGEINMYTAQLIDEDHGGILEVWSRDPRLLELAPPKNGSPRFFHLQMSIRPSVRHNNGTKKVTVEVLDIIKAAPKTRTFSDVGK